MPNISIDQLQIFDGLDGSQIFPHVHPSNNVTYHAHVSAIFYNNAVTEDVIKDDEISLAKLKSNSVDNDKIVNTGDFTFANTTVNKLIVEDNVSTNQLRLNQLDYSFPAIREANKFLKHTTSGNLEWATASEVGGSGGGGSINLVFSETIPVGAITQWGSTDTPAGWLICNGAGFDGTVYPDLSAIVGDTYKVHNGNTYYLPDYRGRVPVGVGSTRDINQVLSSFTIGLTGGEFFHTILLDEMPKHDHLIFRNANSGSTNITTSNQTVAFSRAVGDGGLTNENFEYTMGETTSNERANAGQTSDSGSSNAQFNVQPFLASNYIIKAKKDTVVNFLPTLGRGLSAKDADGTVNTSTLNLSSSEVGILADDNDFEFDGDKRLHLKTTALIPEYKPLAAGTIGLNITVNNPTDTGTTITYNFDDFTGTDIDMTRVGGIYVDAEITFDTDNSNIGESNISVLYTYPNTASERLIADESIYDDVASRDNKKVTRDMILLPIKYTPGGTFSLKIKSTATTNSRTCRIEVHGVQQYGS